MAAWTTVSKASRVRAWAVRSQILSLLKARSIGQRAAYLGYQKAVQTRFEGVTTNLLGFENYQRVASCASYLEVVTAQRSVLDAEPSLTAGRREQFLLLIDLYHALGGGWMTAAVVE